MNNKTINFNCGQLIQLIGKTINFSEPLPEYREKKNNNNIRTRHPCTCTFFVDNVFACEFRFPGGCCKYISGAAG